MSQQKLSVEIYGQQLNLKSAANPEYTSELADFVDGHIRKVSSQSNDPLKVALLASMNIANEPSPSNWVSTQCPLSWPCCLART